jgi:hypothetical protein
MKCSDYTQAHCEQHPACAQCPAEDRKRTRTWWQERCERMEGALRQIDALRKPPIGYMENDPDNGNFDDSYSAGHEAGYVSGVNEAAAISRAALGEESNG